MKNLIRFLWMKERFNHLWTFLAVWLTGTLLIVLMEGDEQGAIGCTMSITLCLFLFRFHKIINVFFDKTNFLLPVSMWQKYLSLLLFNMPFTIVVWVFASILSVFSGKVVLMCMGYGAETLDLACFWSLLMQHPIILASIPFACLTMFTLYVYKEWMGPWLVFWLFYWISMLMKRIHFLDGMVSDETIVIVLLLCSVVMLPVSWLVFKRVQNDRIKSCEDDKIIWQSGSQLKN